MKVIRHSDANFAGKLRELTAPPACSIRKSSNARAPSCDVYVHGDDALLEFTEKFDGAKLAADQLAVTQAELFNASLEADESLRAAVAEAEKNIADFARKSLRKNWQTKNSHGATVGEKFDPFQRVGVYIPGGKAPLVSTALMTITLAKVAGCPEIVVCTPCGRDGSINPALLFAARAAGATEIYRVGGAQAIAAMAYGTRPSAGCRKFSVPATPTSSPPNDCSSATSRLICCPARANCSCWRTTRPIRNSSPPTCWRRPSTAPATNASGW